MIEGLTYLAKLVNFITIVLPLLFKPKALFSEFPDLNLIILIVEHLPLVFLEPNPKHLDFIGKPLDFNGLEDHNKLKILPQICFLVVGQILNPGSQ